MLPARALPDVTVLHSPGVATQLDRATAEQIARDVVANLGNEADAVLRRDPDRATAGAAGERLASVWARIDAAGATVDVPEFDLRHMTVKLERNEGQGPPLVLADLEGTVQLVSYRGSPPTVQARGAPTAYRQTLELVLTDGRYLIVGSRGPTPPALAAPAVERRAGHGDRAAARGRGRARPACDFRHGAFRFKTSNDPAAAMGGGLCWLDYDGDGWLDLYVVNSYSIEGDLTQWKRRGGTPRSALYRNERGRFVDVSRGSGANVSLRGSGCVAGDLNGDGHTDLYVTADGYDALLWNRGNGTLRRGRPRRRHRDVRLAQRRCRRRRERRRPARPLRVELRRPERPGAGREQRLPGQRPRRPRPPLPQPRPRRARPLALPRRRAAGRRRDGAGRPRPRRRLHGRRTTTAGSTSTWRTTRTRTGCS